MYVVLVSLNDFMSIAVEIGRGSAFSSRGNLLDVYFAVYRYYKFLQKVIYILKFGN